jgi:hypothetical protein
VDEGIARLLGARFNGEAAMAQSQSIAKFGEQTTRILSCVRVRDSVMQVDFNFSPTCVAVVGEHFDQVLVILLGGIEVGVNEWSAIVIAKIVDYFRILARPRFEATLLLRPRDALLAVFGIDGGFEVVSECEDDMDWSPGWRAKGARGRGGQNPGHIA